MAEGIRLEQKERRRLDDWEQIIRDHGPTVWRTVYRMLNHEADARDCYQEVWVSAWQLAKKSPISNWPGMLRHLATRRAIDRLRLRYRQKRSSEPLELDHHPASGPLPEDRLATCELADQLRAAVAKLSDQQAEAFWLCCIDQQSYNVVAEQMQLEPGHVRVLVHRARTQLHKTLALAIELPKSKVSRP